MKRLCLLLCAFVLDLDVQAKGEHAVVRIPSHGGSGTVIATTQGHSLILSCAHMLQGAARHKPMALDVPVPTKPAHPGKVGVVVLDVDYKSDLSLIRLNHGPLPYVCPVAPAGHRPGNVLSVGYDNMQMPPQMRPATIVSSQGRITWTKQKPWHGRSGGGLIDADAGLLIGVVQAYETSPGGRGMYASHSAVLAFLAKQQGSGVRGQESERKRWPAPPAPPRGLPRLPAPISGPPGCTPYG